MFWVSIHLSLSKSLAVGRSDGSICVVLSKKLVKSLSYAKKLISFLMIYCTDSDVDLPVSSDSRDPLLK